MARLRCLALVCLSLVLPAHAAGWLGPRITAVGPMTLREALDRVGRQLNVHLQVPWGPLADVKATLALHDASPTAAVAALQEAYGCRIRRAWRWGYQVEPAPPNPPAVGQPTPALSQPTPALGQLLPPPCDTWTVWLQAIRATFSSSLVSLDPGSLQRRAAITPSLAIQTPSDAEGMRISGCTAPRGLTPDGVELRSQGGEQAIRWNASYADPSVWLMEPSLAPPRRGVTKLTALSFDVEVVQLTEHRFGFALSDNGQVQSDPALDVTLDSSKGARDLRLEVRQSLAGGRRDRVMELMRREASLDARLYDGNDRPLYTTANVTENGGGSPLWRMVYGIRLADADPQAKAARLELRLYVPSNAFQTYHVAFHDVPLPPLP